MAILPMISRICAGKLLNAAINNQGDVLGYRNYSQTSSNEDDEDDVDESDQENLILELSTDALSAQDEGVLEQLLRTTTRDQMDAVTAALLLHMGIVPAAALVLRQAILGQNAAIDIVDASDSEGDDDKLSCVIGFRESWELALNRDRDLHWSSEGTFTVDSLPETLAIAATGKPLRHVISHPALDKMDLTIEKIDTGPAKAIITLAGYADGAQNTLDKRALEALRKERLKAAA